MATTDHMPARVKAGIDTDLIQPTNELECSSKCPSFVKDRCLVIGFHKNSVESARASGNSYTRVDYCAPVFDEIQRLYGEDKKRRAATKDDTCVRHIECAVVAKALDGDSFDDEATRLLSEGWRREGRLHVETLDVGLVGVQMFTRTHYVPVVTFDGEKDEECDHAFISSNEHRGKYVCTSCSCFGVRLSASQRSQCDDVLVISVKEYEERFLP
jgi:hypothetical protein